VLLNKFYRRALLKGFPFAAGAWDHFEKITMTTIVKTNGIILKIPALFLIATFVVKVPNWFPKVYKNPKATTPTVI